MRIETKIPIDLDFIRASLGMRTIGDRRMIRGISTDTRDLLSNDLFIPLKSEKNDGENYIKDAIRLGAYTISAKHQSADFKVNDPLFALLSIAKGYKKLLPIKSTVAITGSVGKTTTKELAASLLSYKFKVHATYENFNNEIGVPLTVLSAPTDTEILIIEAGMNHSGELTRISQTVSPDICVITSIGTSHIGNFGSREAIAQAKKELLAGSSTEFALIPYGEILLSDLKNFKTVSVGNLTYSNYSLSVKSQPCEEMLFDFYDGNTLMRNLKCELLGAHIPQCMAYALSICKELEYNESDIKNALEALAVKSLHTNFINIGNVVIIDDAYNSSLESTKAALKTLKSFSGKRIAVLGDVLELGEHANTIHSIIGKLCTDANLFHLYTYGNFAKEIATGAEYEGMDKNCISMYSDTSDMQKLAIDILKQLKSEKVTLLIKGSHKLNLSELTRIICAKLKGGEDNE